METRLSFGNRWLGMKRIKAREFKRGGLAAKAEDNSKRILDSKSRKNMNIRPFCLKGNMTMIKRGVQSFLLLVGFVAGSIVCNGQAETNGSICGGSFKSRKERKESGFS